MDAKIRELYLSAQFGKNEQSADYKTGNTDVIVSLENRTEAGEIQTTKYLASFFTYHNIGELQNQHQATGEFLKGKYFFSKNMLLIDECSFENVKLIIQDLIEEGNFQEVFFKM